MQQQNHTQMMKEVDVEPIFMDLRDKFDSDLLKRFYDELMIPNFPIRDGVFGFVFIW
jgi:hypothetical protein